MNYAARGGRKGRGKKYYREITNNYEAKSPTPGNHTVEPTEELSEGTMGNQKQIIEGITFFKKVHRIYVCRKQGANILNICERCDTVIEKGVDDKNELVYRRSNISVK